MKSKKENLKSVLLKVIRHVQSYKIMVLMKKMNINELKSCDMKEKYKPVPDVELWRIPLLKNIIEVRTGTYQFEGFTHEEVDEMLECFCIS